MQYLDIEFHSSITNKATRHWPGRRGVQPVHWVRCDIDDRQGYQVHNLNTNLPDRFIMSGTYLQHVCVCVCVCKHSA